MKITRKSRLSGIVRTMDLDITQEQLLDYEKGMSIQSAFSNLTPDEREFFMTGITADEWSTAIGDEPDDVKNGHHGC